MKQNLTKLFKATALALFIITAGCSTDDNNDSHEHLHESPLVKTVPFEELIKQSRFNNAFNKLHKKTPLSGNEISSRTFMEQEYGFTIEDTSAKVIESDSTVSYTLLISRAVFDAGSFENLVLQVNKSDESITASVLKYNLTSAMVSSVHGSSSFAYNMEATPIVYDASEATAKMGNSCFMVSVLACIYGGTEHFAGEKCKNTYPVSIEVCFDAGQGGGSSGGPVGGDGPSSPGTPNTGSNPGQHGGGGGNSGGGTVVTSPVTMTPAQALTARKKAFSQRLRSESLQLAFNALPANVQSELWNFLESSLTNGELTLIASAYPAEAIEFAVQATSALTEGGEVDFDSRIIKKNSFVENDCLNNTFEEFNNTSTSFNYFINQFDSDFSLVDLSLSAGTFSTPNPPNALTTVLSNNLIEIKFNTSALNRPKLSIARTMIHEFIHALIYRRLLEKSSIEGETLLSLSQAEVIEMRDRFAELWINYNRYQLGIPQNGVISDFQHQFMADKYRTVIETALSQYDNNAHPHSFYEALAWEGLMGKAEPGQTFNDQTGLYPNSTVAWLAVPQTERLAIVSTIQTFDNSNPSNPCN